MSKLKMALDLHGVYDTNPQGFNQLVVDFFEHCEFYIFSGSPKRQMISEIRKLMDIVDPLSQYDPISLRTDPRYCESPGKYEQYMDGTNLMEIDTSSEAKYPARFVLLSIVDFCRQQNFPMELKPSRRNPSQNHWYFAGHESVWWSMKAVVCDIHQLDVLVDDKEQYLTFFSGRDHHTEFLLHKTENGDDVEGIRAYLTNKLILSNLKGDC